jgi:hypothetical protein
MAEAMKELADDSDIINCKAGKESEAQRKNSSISGVVLTL